MEQFCVFNFFFFFSLWGFFLLLTFDVFLPTAATSRLKPLNNLGFSCVNTPQHGNHCHTATSVNSLGLLSHFKILISNI